MPKMAKLPERKREGRKMLAIQADRPIKKKARLFFTKVILRIHHYGMKYPYAEKANQA